MTICYFTASGNCLDVASNIGGTLFSIPQLMREDSTSNGTIGSSALDNYAGAPYALCITAMDFHSVEHVDH